MTMQNSEFFQDVMEQTRQTLDSGFQATTRMWDAASRMFTQPGCFPMKFEEFQGCGDRMNRMVAPMMRDNVDVVSHALDAQFKSNVDFFRRSFDKVQGKGKDVNWTQAAQDTIRDAFSAMRSGIEIAGETGSKVAKNWSNLLGECCGEKTENGKTNKTSGK